MHDTDKILAALRRVYTWADDHEDIDWNDQPNEAMHVKRMIYEELGHDLVRRLLVEAEP